LVSLIPQLAGPKKNIARLRYILGGDRPSQTNYP